MSLEANCLRSDELIAVAAELASRIAASRVQDRRGGVSWRGPHNPSPGSPVQLSPVGPHLYGGFTGIALFLAAFVRVSGEREYCSLIFEILEPLRRKLAAIVTDPARAASPRLGVGGLVGIGGFAYAFHQIGEWLGEVDLLRESEDLLPLFSEERIAADQLLDVVGGSAGGLLSLLAVTDSEWSGSPLVRRTAALFAEHLRRAQLQRGGRAGGWQTIPWCPPLSGFSHGAAGICFALLRLYEKTRDETLFSLASDGLVFEQSLYSPSERNWQDLRNPGSGFSVSWCHGAPGVALGRIGALRVMDGEAIREQIGEALETTRLTPLADLDHVCCGNMGRIEILLHAAEKLRRPDLLTAAHDLASRVLRRVRSRGRFGWVYDLESDVFDPSFFTGAAGVGYTLLRLAKPDLLPCVLLLE